MVVENLIGSWGQEMKWLNCMQRKMLLGGGKMMVTWRIGCPQIILVIPRLSSAYSPDPNSTGS
jgi:hypothetical protein